MAHVSATISTFSNVRATTPDEFLSLETMLQRIHDGTYAPIVQRLRHIRALRGEKAYRLAKEQTLSFTPACALSRRDRDTPWRDKLRSATGLVHYDLDHLADAVGVKDVLRQNPHVTFAFISPRGDGLKIGVAATGIHDAATYKAAWPIVLKQLKHAYPTIHFNEDPHVRYIHALCFVSHDADLHFRAEAPPMIVPLAPRHPQRTGQRSHAYGPDAARVAEALDAIPNHDAGYDTWLTLGMALHSAGAPWGRSLWDTWSRQSSKFDERKQQRSWESFTRDGATTLGTLFYLAEQAGWHAHEAWTKGHRFHKRVKPYLWDMRAEAVTGPTWDARAIAITGEDIGSWH